MRTLKKNWARFAGLVALASLAVCAVYACVSVWGQTAPVLNIAATGTNQMSIIVSNGVSNGVYQLYYREFLNTNYPWIFITNGAHNQTNFQINIGDTVSGFFQATYNPGFVTPTITVVIQSPTNGALIY
jgi:hypothetical protein